MDTTIELNADKLIWFVKYSLLQLATSNLNHRNYGKEDRNAPSLLVQKINERDGDFEKGILDVCVLAVENEHIMDMFQQLQEEENEEEMYMLREEFFQEMVSFIGLYEINSLHGCENDKFLDTFYQFIYKK